MQLISRRRRRSGAPTGSHGHWPALLLDILLLLLLPFLLFKSNMYYPATSTALETPSTSLLLLLTTLLLLQKAKGGGGVEDQLDPTATVLLLLPLAFLLFLLTFLLVLSCYFFFLPFRSCYFYCPWNSYCSATFTAKRQEEEWSVNWLPLSCYLLCLQHQSSQMVSTATIMVTTIQLPPVLCPLTTRSYFYCPPSSDTFKLLLCCYAYFPLPTSISPHKHYPTTQFEHCVFQSQSDCQSKPSTSTWAPPYVLA